ncbi:hypothetical protein BGW36DRAFT_288166 [Talaromyces proteolyticus]|uniref:Uncharacterized protein n=1 Tax=Talaromyces proteolyticus TaxID=1131652 RepID=A0AAD4KYD9_9EURO|nr:uncharacterized protein BGW36DRAFT_288166 [Talaromyces proteolyticus]KAH8703222.1 hypothetical protein BGW36DRAFT_288166 [Talaromyces proteolyticus]
MTTTAAVGNANHIFNAIHSSMRQWGSSWNHNGMSFFLATVPQHTMLYHGSHSNQPVTSFEWLAFEPEHALWFVNKWMGHHKSPSYEIRAKGSLHSNQAPLKQERAERGWLHTYAASKDLRLLYIDGISAGKSEMGTLDSQDRILFNDTIEDSHDDISRAMMACKLFSEDWDGRIDGLIRMETGFEIILCDFAHDLHLVNMVRGKPYSDDGSARKPVIDEMWRLYKVIAKRYSGIGGDRVRLNYDQFVTAYGYPELDLFNQSSGLPRLTNISLNLLEPIKQDLSDLVMSTDPSQTSYNWQHVTDMIVTRYSDDLKYFVSGKLDTVDALQLEIERVLLPFIDFDNRDSRAEINRCTGYFQTPNQPSSTIASAAVNDVSSTICSTLRSALDIVKYDDVVLSIQNLIDYLSWTTWNECPQKCDNDEACFIPIWPAGTVEDRENPQCRDGPYYNKSSPPYWDKRPFQGGQIYD